MGRPLLVESLLGPDRVLGRPAAFGFVLAGSEFLRFAVGFLGDVSVVDRCAGLGFSTGALGASSLRVALPLLDRACKNRQFMFHRQVVNRGFGSAVRFAEFVN